MAKEGNTGATSTGDLFGAKPDASSKTTYRIPAPPSINRNMSEQKKQEQDFTKEVDTILPTTTKLAQVSPSDVLLAALRLSTRIVGQTTASRR